MKLPNFKALEATAAAIKHEQRASAPPLKRATVFARLLKCLHRVIHRSGVHR